MEVVARFHDAISAQQLVVYLQAHGIHASTAGGLLESFGPIVGAFKGQYTVGVLDKENLPQAQALSEQFLQQRPILEESWEHDVEPDLTLLDPAHLPSCPSCGLYLLKPLPDDARCPFCSTELDLVALIVEQHGPEALADCYPTESISDSNEIDQQAITMMDFPCRRCRYSLRGLDRKGVCPECAEPYDKCPWLD